MGVVLNSPITNVNLLAVSKAVDIPVVITVVSEDTDVSKRLINGASIINVAAGEKTAEVVRKIREKHPDVPIIATSGKSGESITQTIKAGANAITYTPPTTAELFKSMMQKYREP